MSDTATVGNQPAVTPGTVMVVENGKGLFGQDLLAGRHRLVADEPRAVGGDDAGPNPYELLLMSLGACTSMTLRLYARRKQLPLTRVAVRLRHSRIHSEDCADCETKAGFIDRIEREIVLEGALSEEQRKRMMEIANMCPVHKTLMSEISIVTQLAPA
jgi:putative redox protein